MASAKRVAPIEPISHMFKSTAWRVLFSRNMSANITAPWSRIAGFWARDSSCSDVLNANPRRSPCRLVSATSQRSSRRTRRCLVRSSSPPRLPSSEAPSVVLPVRCKAVSFALVARPLKNICAPRPRMAPYLSVSIFTRNLSHGKLHRTGYSSPKIKFLPRCITSRVWFLSRLCTSCVTSELVKPAFSRSSSRIVSSVPSPCNHVNPLFVSIGRLFTTSFVATRNESTRYTFAALFEAFTTSGKPGKRLTTATHRPSSSSPATNPVPKKSNT
mmetsp:Transcript_18600/g.34465  ORF Transcript_18600/g.34465 Transcript_18600/m.34465 type:complete len:272 (-) Transcript_18600:293-1108(-)